MADSGTTRLQDFARYGARPPIHRRRDPLTRLRTLGLLYLWFKAERRSRVRLSAWQRLRAWRHGFSSADWVLYDLSRNDPRGWVTTHSTLTYRFLVPIALAVNDKAVLALCLDRIGVAHPEVFGILRRGWLLAPGGGGREPLASWLERAPAERLVFKPIDGAKGTGILFWHRRGAGLEINGVPTPLARALDLVSQLENYLVTEFVVQAPYAAGLYPRTTNTVRVLTLWDDERGEPFIAAATHRMGRASSGAVDNFQAGKGGLCARIDLESGELGPAAGIGADGRLHRSETHPDTGARIAGVRVPGWEKVLEMVMKLAWSFPESPFIGWDLVVTERGPVLLEANAPPGITVWQVNESLLRDERVRRFFRAYDIV